MIRGSDLRRYEAPAEELRKANEWLASFAPRQDRAPWLHAYYEPGDFWAPVERIIIAEMVPEIFYIREHQMLVYICGSSETSAQSTWAELTGPSPRDFCDYDKILKKIVWRKDPSTNLRYSPTITHRQWLLFREYRALAKPVWVLQGESGGHRRKFSEFEVTLNRMKGRPAEAPYPGHPGYPFAPFDNRVKDALITARRLADFHNSFTSRWGLNDRHRSDNNDQPSTADAYMSTMYDQWLAAQTEEVLQGS